MFDYKVVESKLNEALSLLSNTLANNQIENLRTEITAGEWGLALKSLSEMLYEDELPVPSSAYELLQEARSIMNIKDDLLEQIRPQVLNITSNENYDPKR